MKNLKNSILLMLLGIFTKLLAMEHPFQERALSQSDPISDNTYLENELNETARGWHNLPVEIQAIVIWFLPECLGLYKLSIKDSSISDQFSQHLLNKTLSLNWNSTQLSKAFRQFALLQTVNHLFALVLRYTDLSQIIKNMGKFHPTLLHKLFNKAAKSNWHKPFELAKDGEGILASDNWHPWLLKASACRNFKLAKSLIEMGALRNISAPELTSLLILNNYEEFKQSFLEREPRLHPTGLPYLLNRAAQCGLIEIFEFLLKKIKIQNGYLTNLNLALFYATRFKQHHIIESLLKEGADPKTLVSGTPIILDAKDISSMKLFLDKGHDIHLKAFPNISEIPGNFSKERVEAGQSILHIIISDLDKELIAEKVKFLLEQNIDINGTTLAGETPLIRAIQMGLLDIVKLLLDKGADITMNGYLNSTPLHYAASHGDPELIEFLIDKGINVNAKNQQGLLPIHFAALGGHLEAVQLLVKKGATIDAPCSIGIIYDSTHSKKFEHLVQKTEAGEERIILSTPAEYALFGNHLEVVNFLLAYSRDTKEKPEEN